MLPYSVCLVHVNAVTGWQVLQSVYTEQVKH